MENLNILRQLIKEEFDKAINNKKAETPTTDITLEGKPYTLRLDVNRNPTKKGIKVQFVPLSIEPTGKLDTDKKMPETDKNDAAIKILAQLNAGLKSFGLEADIDPDVPYKNVIGFYIHLQYFDKIVRDALKAGNKPKETPKPIVIPKDAIQNEKSKEKTA